MADLCDLAKERDDGLREAALTAFRSRPQPIGEGALNCQSCYEPIAEKRRKVVKTMFCAVCADQLSRGK